MWPFICQFIEKLFKETIEPAVRGANNHLSTFSFTKIAMGNQPLRIDGVKVYTENVDKRQIVLDLQISFVGNSEIDMEVKRYFCRAGIKSIQIHGTMRVILEPLIGDMPLIGALSLFFLRKPIFLSMVRNSQQTLKYFGQKVEIMGNGGVRVSDPKFWKKTLKSDQIPNLEPEENETTQICRYVFTTRHRNKHGKLKDQKAFRSSR
ncbi:extended synaptotagmin-2-like [Protopterus annectens]|uniref:extended synaptotagmin-2-like n=1 Tax=Protopterus annectens TaxID=7888 RepID=UPI001CFB1297|nr:extended synaptotagmin-2-like [Protopterus annectens]